MKNFQITRTPVKINFVLKGGGIGDYCAWTGALSFIYKNFPHVNGFLYAEAYFVEILKNLFPKWPIQPFEALPPKEPDTVPTFIPISASPALAYICPVSPMGASLMEMGFIYFTQRNGPPTPEDGFYPQLDLTNTNNPIAPYKYRRTAVMIPSAAQVIRQMPAPVFNGIKDFLTDKGFLPVFLGKGNQSKNINATFDPDCDFSNGVNLLDKTTLLEAAKVISVSHLVVGLDNGLLHLAGMTQTPIVYGHNIIDPKYRTITRANGKVVNVIPPKKVACRFCHSKERFLFDEGFNNKNCWVTLKEERPKCVDEMSADSYIQAIEEVLK